MNSPYRPEKLLLLLLALFCLQSICSAETIRFEEEGVTLLPSEEGSPGNALVIGAGDTLFHRTTNPVSGARVIAVPGSAVRIFLWQEELETGRKQSFYAISRDGRELSGRVRATTYSIRLAGESFDPLVESKPVSPVLGADASNTLFLVQFVTTPLPSFSKTITALGGEIHRFLTDHTFLVEMAPGLREQVAALPFVRWVGPYHPAYRVEPDLREALAGRSSPLETQRYSIMLCERSDARQRAAARAIDRIGGEVHLITPGGIRLEATLSHDQLLAATRSDAVQYIDRWGGPGETDMNIVRSVGGADFLEGLMGWTGQGVRGEIFDTELRTSHQEWPLSPIIHSSGTSGSYHGTSCYSINFAQGIDSAARGMLPDGEGIFFLYSESTQFGGSKSRYTLNDELTDPNGPYRAVFQTSSVGSSRTLYYTTISAETDDYLFHYPILSTQSQSNAGDQMSRPQAWAKNIVSVGGIYHYGTATRTDDRWAGGASIGPAEDGRIKPDLAYFYDGIRAAYGSSDTSYTEFGGTSAATPETAGHFGLLFQMWHEQVWAGHGGGADVFDSAPQMATAKALMINSAYRYDWTQGGSNGDITRDIQGWGTAQVQNLYERAPKTIVIDESDPILPLETKTYPVNLAAGESEFNVTLAYTDPMGTVGAAQQRINDLSLKVTSPSSTVYWGNNGLRSGNVSTPGGSSNTIDTVENVFVANPESGTWIVEVIGDEIVQDSHLETPGTDADFALVIFGVTTSGNLPPNTPSAPGPAEGETAVSVDTDLGWNGGDPNSGDTVWYDIYFGTDPNPPFAGRIGPYPATQTAITYDPGTLANGTLYHWKIVAEDDQSGVTEGSVWSFTTVELNVPPDLPANPDPSDGAVDVSFNVDLGWDGGDPNSGDTVTYDIYLGTTNPPAYLDTTPGYPSTQTRITYDPGTLTTQTLYYWQIVARDGSGASANGPVWSFTTGTAQPLPYYATQDITVQNGGISGDYTNTFASDDSYEGITEHVSVRSSLEHQWTIDVPGGLSVYLFSVEAHHTVNSEGDDFVFAYSTDGINFVDMVTVTKTADDDTAQTYLLPTSLAGTVTIRVLDKDRTRRNRVRDTIYVDRMFIEGSGTPPPNDPPNTPASPAPADGATGVGVNDGLAWSGGDPNAIDTITYDVYLGTTNPPAFFATTPGYSASQTAIGFDPGTLLAQTQYYWQIVAADNGGLSATGQVWSFTTGQVSLIFDAGQDIAVSNGGIEGNFAETHVSDDVYEAISERASNKSFLEHKWTIAVAGGYTSYTFNVEAHHTFNTEGDDFIFAYSTDGVNFMNIVTVTKTADDDSLQQAMLPASLAGTITIRIRDIDRTKGNKALDTVFIDRMFIEAGN